MRFSLIDLSDGIKCSISSSYYLAKLPEKFTIKSEESGTNPDPLK